MGCCTSLKNGHKLCQLGFKVKDVEIQKKSRKCMQYECVLCFLMLVPGTCLLSYKSMCSQHFTTSSFYLYLSFKWTTAVKIHIKETKTDTHHIHVFICDMNWICRLTYLAISSKELSDHCMKPSNYVISSLYNSPIYHVTYQLFEFSNPLIHWFPFLFPHPSGPISTDLSYQVWPVLLKFWICCLFIL